MTEDEREKQRFDANLTKQIGVKAARKLKARRNTGHTVWFGLGMMGLIGWSVVVPTLLGAGLGIYFDIHYPSERSWTLALIVAGLIIGCANAWHWVAKEEQAIHEEYAEEDVAVSKKKEDEHE